MRSIFKSVANELITQLTPEDLKEIMDSTIATVLQNMTPEQRLDFSKEIVTSAVTQILSGFDDAQRAELVYSILPHLLREAHVASLDPEELLRALRGPNGGV